MSQEQQGLHDEHRAKKTRTNSMKKNFPRYLVMLLLACIAAVYAWKIVSERELRTSIENQSIESSSLLKERTRSLLRLTAKPLAWVVRTEVMNGNLGRVKNYFRDFVKEPDIERIMYVRNDGKIIVATDKNLEGQEISNHLRDSFNTRNETVIDEDKDGTLRVMIPIMGYSAILGTVVVSYRAQAG